MTGRARLVGLACSAGSADGDPSSLRDAGVSYPRLPFRGAWFPTIVSAGIDTSGVVFEEVFYDFLSRDVAHGVVRFPRA